MADTAQVRSDERPRTSAAERTKDLALWLTALVGVLALLFFAASHLFGLTVIVFRTGSMAPILPQGAAALSVPVAPSDLRIGDVVTVDRGPDSLPITHRVVSIEQAADADERTLVLQGDANAMPDREPYVVDDAKRVLAGAPHLGHAIAAVQSPGGMATITVTIALLITWGLWPARKDTEEP